MATQEEPTRLDTLRREDGTLPAYTSVGGYTIVYLTADSLVLCAPCANKPVDEWSNPAVDGDVYWEGPPMECDDCNAAIESSYGDPDATD